MTLLYKELDTTIKTSTVETKEPIYSHILQLLVNLAGIYMAHEISVEVWRSLTGH